APGRPPGTGPRCASGFVRSRGVEPTRLAPTRCGTDAGQADLGPALRPRAPAAPRREARSPRPRPPTGTTPRLGGRPAGGWRRRRRTRIGTLPRPTGWTNGCRRLPVPPVGSVPNGMAIHEEPDTVGGNVDVADLWFGNAFVGLDQQ